MLKEERQQIILNELHEFGKVMVNDLSDKFNISKDTVRRDLNELEEKCMVRRVFGGALPYNLPVPDYSQRERVNRSKKYEMAKEGLKYINEGQFIVLDGGSTNKMLASIIPINYKLTILTNSFPIANELRNHVNVKVILVGGDYLHESLTTVGEIAVEQVSRYNPDVCFLGVYAVDKKYGITAPYLEEVSIKRTFVEISDITITLSTQEKIKRKSKYKICNYDEISMIITDE